MITSNKLIFKQKLDKVREKRKFSEECCEVAAVIIKDKSNERILEETADVIVSLFRFYNSLSLKEKREVQENIKLKSEKMQQKYLKR